MGSGTASLHSSSRHDWLLISLGKNLVVKDLCLKLFDFSKSYQALKIKGERKITGLFLKYIEILNSINSKNAEDLFSQNELSMLSIGHICLTDGIAKVFLKNNVKSNMPSEWETELGGQKNQKKANANFWDDFDLPTSSEQDYSYFKTRQFFLNTIEFDLV